MSTNAELAAILAAHPCSPEGHEGGLTGLPFCYGDHPNSTYWPCETYRLAETLAVERARVQRVEEVLAEHWDWKAGLTLHAALTAALAGVKLERHWPAVALADNTEGERPCKCGRPLGDKPSWMSWDQCTCCRTDAHNPTDCYCGQHDDDASLAQKRFAAGVGRTPAGDPR